MITEHQAILADNLKNASQLGRILFSILCADRIRVCCWAFTQAYGHDLSPVVKLIDEAAQSVILGKILKIRNENRKQINVIYPPADEFPSPLAAQARYGVEAAQNTLQLCEDDEVSFAISAATNVIDAIDNYEYFTWYQEPDVGEFSSNDSNWLLRSEVEHQVEQSRSVHDLDLSAIRQLRIENRFFRIPPAIDYV